MCSTRSVILASATGLLTLSGAQAADLPVKAKAVEYVRICSLYGAGFFYIPGTDTCIKIGGYLRADTTFNGGAHGAPAWNSDLGQQNRRGPNLRAGRLPVQQFRQLQSGHALGVPGRIGERAVHPWRWLCGGRISLHPVRRLHLR